MPKIHTRMTFHGDWAAILDDDQDLGVFVCAEGKTEEEALKLLKEKLDAQ